MTTRLVLQFHKPSHALTVAEPWTRLLVEVESPTSQGHLVGTIVALRKGLNTSAQIDRIEVVQLQTAVASAQRVLDAALWWLQKPPFHLARLSVVLIAHAYAGELVSIPGSTVTELDVSVPKGDFPYLAATERDNASPLEEPFPVDFADLRKILPSLKRLNVSGYAVCDGPPRHVENTEWLCSSTQLQQLFMCGTDFADVDAIPLEHLEVLSLTRCRKVTVIDHLQNASSLLKLALQQSRVSNLEPLRGRKKLQDLDISFCAQVTDGSAIAGLPCLEMLNAQSTSLTSADFALACPALTSLKLQGCEHITDLPSFADFPALQHVELMFMDIQNLNFAAHCTTLRAINVSFCSHVNDLSPLAGLPQLELVAASYTDVSDVACLCTCLVLRAVRLVHCKELHDLSPLAGMQHLEEIDASYSGVTNVTDLETCPSLRSLCLYGTRAAATGKKRAFT